MRRRGRSLLWALGALALAGCVSTFPADLTRTVDRTLTVAELRRDPTAYVGRRVIVGGEIVSTVPKPGQTEIDLLTRRLLGDDSPERSDASAGRVLVRTGEFLDPAVYAAGRSLTVLGTVTGAEERRIGDLPYGYPVISAERLKLWPLVPPVARDPWWPYYYYYYGWMYPWPYRPYPMPPYWPYWW